ncbi:hypothetical protein LXL04_031637 [Taraxacum kok-saghyz]
MLNQLTSARRRSGRSEEEGTSSRRKKGRRVVGRRVVTSRRRSPPEEHVGAGITGERETKTEEESVLRTTPEIGGGRSESELSRVRGGRSKEVQ